MESHGTGFPPFPLLLEIPSGFPHSPRIDDGIHHFKRLREASGWCRSRHRKGLVTDVSGPQRNACPGTLTPLPCLLSMVGRREFLPCIDGRSWF